MRRAALSVLAVLSAVSVTAVATAQADVFEPASLASVGQVEGSAIGEQANIAAHPALSADGRYVAFEGSFGGVKGVWRRDLATGAVAQVAGGAAQLPSISADGRYVSFTTNEGHELATLTDHQIHAVHPEVANVYRRDMDLAPGAPGAFEVASAPSGSDVPLSYETTSSEAGSLASGRSAITSDGNYVAFVTTAVSNLVGPHTPALQVAVRDMQTKETKLVSVEYENGHATERPVATTGEFGAVYGAANRFLANTPSAAQGAAISADGSTVAWLGQEVAKQAAVLASPIENRAEYVEPLWRRIGNGPQEATRRVTGGSDPAAPACIASGETQPAFPPTLADPCQGPFENEVQHGEGRPGIYALNILADGLPRLDGDGLVVAFVASQRYLAGGEEFSTAEGSADLYVVDMAAGLTRVQALRRLTEVASGNANVGGGSAPVTDVGVSPDGTEVGFASERTAFPLGSPAYVSPAVSKSQMQEIYSVDLANSTLTRVTHGYQAETQQSEPAGNGGSATEREAAAPSFSGDGNTVAFSSAASNLVYGDATRTSSVYVAGRKHFPAEPVPQYISPAPSSPNTEPSWLLAVSAHSRRDGTVALEVQTPGAGEVSASARSSMRVVAKSARGARRRAKVKVVSRQVAHGAKAAPDEALVTLVLKLDPHYRSLATQSTGLAGSVEVVFSAPGHAALHDRLLVKFHNTLHSSHRAKKKRAKKARRR